MEATDLVDGLSAETLGKLTAQELVAMLVARAGVENGDQDALVAGLSATALGKLAKGDLISMMRTCVRGRTKIVGEDAGDGHAALAKALQANQKQTAALLSIATYDGEAKADGKLNKPQAWLRETLTALKRAGVAEGDRAAMAQGYLRGTAALFMMKEENFVDEEPPATRWKTFSGRLLDRFVPLGDANRILSELESVKMGKGGLEGLIKVVEALAYEAEEAVTEAALIRYFVNGLTGPLKVKLADIMLTRPTGELKTLKAATDLARGLQFNMADEAGSREDRKQIVAKVFSIGAAGAYVRPTTEELAAKYKLTVAELQARRAAGLCYKCNKAWTRGEHKC